MQWRKWILHPNYRQGQGPQEEEELLETQDILITMFYDL